MRQQRARFQPIKSEWTPCDNRGQDSNL
uniref:Uncharacterized protein n=1 Tax=Arundo donax TaxID=35708 RepID=A0A0A8Z6M6_ARUDO